MNSRIFVVDSHFNMHKGLKLILKYKIIAATIIMVVKTGLLMLTRVNHMVFFSPLVLPPARWRS